GLELWGPERNFYRVRPGQKVKFDTNLYSALREGYCYGTVEIIALDSDVSDSSSASGTHEPTRPPRYYIWVKIDSSPVPLSLGATARAEISLRRDAVYKILFNLD
ncbi:MAG: hypothetical protein NTW86_30650, partial [Candidatus Sumerlaeota bacterium]|nr:hypothetical protein [Candidatus Sumerlaeota bacterium]